MAKTFHDLRTGGAGASDPSNGGKPSVDWHSGEGDSTHHDNAETVPTNSGPVTSNLKSLPSDALANPGADPGEEQIPNNSGGLLSNWGKQNAGYDYKAAPKSMGSGGL